MHGYADGAEGDGVKVRLVGEPLLYGIVGHYLTETLHIFIITVAALVALLFLITRSWHGTILPLTAGVLSAIWALGAAKLMGFHLDPLVIVVAFLITAQAIHLLYRRWHPRGVAPRLQQHRAGHYQGLEKLGARRPGDRTDTHYQRDHLELLIPAPAGRYGNPDRDLAGHLGRIGPVRHAGHGLSVCSHNVTILGRRLVRIYFSFEIGR